MPNPNISTQDWFYHAPMKKSANKKPKQAPAPSQIPGIGGDANANAPPETDDRHFRRKWIRDTDSKYIKLAKSGGRKNLLSFSSPPADRPVDPVPYPRVDWFDHEHIEDDDGQSQLEHEAGNDHEPSEEKLVYRVLPDWYVHVHDLPDDDDECATGNYRSKRPIMAYDNLSTWQRDEKEVKANHGGIKLPRVQKPHRKDKRYGELVAAQQNDNQRKQVRLPKIDSEAINMKHLLSMGYQRDWLSEQRQKVMDERAEKKKQLRESDERRDAQNRNTVAMRKPKDAKDRGRPMFKLSRFEKVEPRVETFRT